MRILGKGLTASAIKEKYPDATWYDDSDLDRFDKESDELTVVSPGIPPFNKLVQSTKNLISEYDLLIPKDKFTIWISGTNGKTTTTAMTQHILEEYGSVCGGNIGTPLAKMDTNTDIWILETSSFTMHYINGVKPNIYLLLPIKDDHLSWHGSFKAYEEAKLKPLALMQSNDIAILPAKYKDIKTDAFCIYYESSSDLENYFEFDSTGLEFEEPFLFDATMALACEKILFDTTNYQKINSFQRAKHTLEEFIDNRGRLWVDDSKGTNVDATIAAIDKYKSKKIELILGGDDKGANLEPLFQVFQKCNIRLYLIGSNIINTETLAKKYNIDYIICNILENGVKKIDQIYLNESSVGILSPAAASLDQFSSYKERGNKFKDLVKKL